MARTVSMLKEEYEEDLESSNKEGFQQCAKQISNCFKSEENVNTEIADIMQYYSQEELTRNKYYQSLLKIKDYHQLMKRVQG